MFAGLWSPPPHPHPSVSQKKKHPSYSRLTSPPRSVSFPPPVPCYQGNDLHSPSVDIRFSPQTPPRKPKQIQLPNQNATGPPYQRVLHPQFNKPLNGNIWGHTLFFLSVISWVMQCEHCTHSVYSALAVMGDPG